MSTDIPNQLVLSTLPSLEFRKHKTYGFCDDRRFCRQCFEGMAFCYSQAPILRDSSRSLGTSSSYRINHYFAYPPPHLVAEQLFSRLIDLLPMANLSFRSSQMIILFFCTTVLQKATLTQPPRHWQHSPTHFCKRSICPESLFRLQVMHACISTTCCAWHPTLYRIFGTS
jgi:hypothetical protein